MVGRTGKGMKGERGGEVKVEERLRREGEGRV